MIRSDASAVAVTGSVTVTVAGSVTGSVAVTGSVTASVAVAVAVAAMLGACGGAAPVFGLTADDNNPDRLARALAVRGAPRTGPRNASGAPMVFAVASGTPRRLVAFDLAAGAARWTVDADVQSRIAVGGDFVVAREASALVARDVATGRVRWQRPLGDVLVGADADPERVYLVEQDDDGKRRSWSVTALAGASGEVVWSATAPGALGAPAADGGIVLVPFLSQWLTVLDARTGALVTRVRGVDEQISFVRDLAGDTFFGGADGVVRLDARAASGRRATSSYGKVALPAPLARATYAADGYDAVQAGYSAHERTRILWWPEPAGDAKSPGLRFAGGGAAVHWFRFVLGVDADGALRWAYVHPRVELVSSAHVGPVLAVASGGGEVLALDPASGAVRARVDLGAGALLGATFDAEGWAPTGEIAAPALAASLVAIARDRDQRWSAIHVMAIARLAGEPGADVTRELLGLVQDERVPAPLRDAAAAALAERAEPAGLPVLAATLAVPDDMIDGTAPVAIAAAARGVAALRGSAIDPGARQAAIAALLLQLWTPATTTRDLAAVVAALVAIGEGAERAPLTRFLLVHRADPEVAGDSALVHAVVDGLVAAGAAEREVVRFVADDPRSAPSVASYAKVALGK